MVAEHQEEHDGQHREAGDRVAQHLIGPERGVRPTPRFLRGEAVLPEQVNVADDERDDQPGDDARMQREETRQRVMPVVAAAHDDLLQFRSDERGDRGDVRGDPRGPEALLVPGQQVTGQRERQHQHQQDDARPEVEFPRGLVGAVDDHLHQVQDEQHGHRVRGVMMEPAQEPAAPHLMLDEVDALPRGLRTRAVRQPEEAAGDHLDHEAERQRAAPDVAPARAAGNVFVERFVDQPLVAGAVVEPVERGLHQTGILSCTPARKFWKVTQTSDPLRISTGSSSRPRGLGLFGSWTLPSRAKLLLWQGQK